MKKDYEPLLQSFVKNPYALETAYVSVIIFAGIPKTLVPLTEVIGFYPPKFPIGPGTSFGAVLAHLASEIDSNVVKNTMETKGDWKPIVFFLTDGNPTDNYEKDLRNWERNFKDKVTSCIVSIGNNCDVGILERISKNILYFEDGNTEAYGEFFKWISNSIQMQSQQVEETNAQGDLNIDALENSGISLSKSGQGSRSRDDKYAIITGRCQKTNLDYLIKFKKGVIDSIFGNLGVGYNRYKLIGSYKLSGSYERLATFEKEHSDSISISELMGQPTCPHCNNPVGMAFCSCNGVFCIDGPGIQSCPWCEVTGMFGQGDGSGINVNTREG